jgi:cell wall-associated NlpC family hydrolase
MMLSGSTAFTSNASLTSGVSSAIVEVAEEQAGGLYAGVTSQLSQFMNEAPDTAKKTDTAPQEIVALPEDEKKKKAAVKKNVTEKKNVTATTKKEKKAVKKKAKKTDAEYANIGISKVEDYVNIRSKASADSEAVGKLYSNSAVTVLGKKGDWYKISSGNCKGYIKSEFIVTGNEKLAKTVGTRVATVNTENLNIRQDKSTAGQVLGQVTTGDELVVVAEADGWIKVATDDGEGFVSSDFVECDTHYRVAVTKEEEEEALRIKEEEERLAAEAAAAAEDNSDSSSDDDSSSSSNGTETSNTSSSSSNESSSSDSGSSDSSDSSESNDSSDSYNPPSGGGGQSVASFATQFVGKPYRYGGSSLTNGADCSGFIMAVYANFGVSLPHSSGSLRGVGYEVSASNMQPGDIICYDGHAAIYIGGGSIVHASNPETGIKISSPANYRPIVAVRRIF